MKSHPVARADLHVHTRFSRRRHLEACNACDSCNEPLAVYRHPGSLGVEAVMLHVRRELRRLEDRDVRLSLAEPPGDPPG